MAYESLLTNFQFKIKQFCNLRLMTKLILYMSGETNRRPRGLTQKPRLLKHYGIESES